MEDNKDNNVTEISEEIRNKLRLRKEVKGLTGGEWTLPQEILQEIQAEDILIEAVSNKKPYLAEQITRMTDIIKEEFKDQPDLLKTIVESIPTYEAIRLWTKKEEWEKEVQKCIRNKNIFNNKNQAKVLDTILKAAVAAPGTMSQLKAAELYFKLEGSLNPQKDAAEKKDEVYERYKNLQQTLHKKK